MKIDGSKLHEVFNSNIEKQLKNPTQDMNIKEYEKVWKSPI